MVQDFISNAIFLPGHDSLIMNGYLLQKGAQLTMPVNLNGFNSYRGNFTWSVFFRKLKSNLSIDAGYARTQSPAMFNYIKTLTTTSVYNLTFRTGGNYSKYFGFNLSWNPSYSRSSSSLQSRSAHNYFSQNINASLYGNIMKGFRINCDFSYRDYSATSSRYAQNFMMLNAGITKKFFKKQNGELQFYVYDILNQGSAVSHTITDLYIQDRQANIQSRYYMITAIFNLRHYNMPH